VTLTNDLPIETVSKMLGHKTLRTTQQYAKILDQKVSEDVMALREKLSRNRVKGTRNKFSFSLYACIKDGDLKRKNIHSWVPAGRGLFKYLSSLL
jgi:hypothetical protein